MIAQIERLISGELKMLLIQNGVVVNCESLYNKLVLSGSFNPIHDGHRQLLLAASKKAPTYDPVFELSLHNADKGYLEVEEIVTRIS